MRKLVLFGFLVIFLNNIMSVNAELSCNVVNGNCPSGYVTVFRMSDFVNAHAELPSQNTYPYSVCCTGVNGLGTGCSGIYDVVATLSDPTNAHIAYAGYYPYDVCLSVPSGQIDCKFGTEAECSGYTILASASDAYNAHVAEPSYYPTKICCSVALSRNTPNIAEMDLLPANPSQNDNLKCEVRASDDDGNLDHVRFEWLVNDVAVKTETAGVSGSFDYAESVLDNSYTASGDEIECRAWVYDTTNLYDYENRVVYVEGNTPPQISGIPDYNVQVGNTIELIDLYPYASDAEDPDADLVFSIDSESEPSVIDCYVTNNRYVGCGSAQQTGYSDITVKVTDSQGLWDTDTFRITVTEQPSHSPQITNMEITPEHPDEYDDLTCKVWVSDGDGDLDRVRFEWYRDSERLKVHTDYVSGSSDYAETVLDNSYTASGDEIECRAWVYDEGENSDYGEETVHIGREECGVDVYNLEIEGNKIEGRIRNTGEDDEEIEYWIYVNGITIENGEVYLDSGESASVSDYYDFEQGESYDIKLKAVAECGASDYEVIWDYISGEICNKTCGVSIESFSYQSHVNKGDSVFISVKLKNTGEGTETVTVRFYVDNELKDSYTFTGVCAGNEVEKTFVYTASVSGSHTIKAEALTNCGAVDTITGSLTVEGFEEQKQTRVEIYPSSVDTQACRGVPVTVDIRTRIPQDFVLEASGVPSGWLSYTKNLRVEEEKKVYIYVTPKEIGRYKIYIKVRAASEGKEFSGTVSLFSAAKSKTSAGSFYGYGLTGTFFQGIANPLLWVLVAVIVILVCAVFFMKQKQSCKGIQPKPQQDLKGVRTPYYQYEQRRNTETRGFYPRNNHQPY